MGTQDQQFRVGSNVKYVLYLSGFLDLCAVSMIMPLILQHAQDIGASPTVAGVIGSVYGGIKLVSSPLMGKWSDRVGRHFSLLICLLLTGCGYAILGLHSSLAVLFAGRFILGCFKHTQTITKSFLADIGPDHERSALLGHFNSFSNIGFVVGPIIGGHLAEISFSLAAFAAGLVFIGNAVLVWLAVRCDTSLERPLHQTGVSQKQESDTFLLQKPKDTNVSLRDLASFFKDVDWNELWDLFLIKFCTGFSMLLFRGNFALALKDKYEASPRTIGYITSYTGLVGTLSGFLVGRITNRYKSSAELILHVTILQVVALLCLSLSTSMDIMLLFLTLLTFVTSMSRVAGTTLTISRCGNARLGSVMGLNQSVMSVARMLTPFLAGVAQETCQNGVAMCSVAAAAFAVVIMLLRSQDPQVRRKLAYQP